ncbi:MAG: hypothetical protein J6L76_07415 [Clostridia bacterium]|nr:hypothetical protein [Clostridia bacterium]
MKKKWLGITLALLVVVVAAVAAVVTLGNTKVEAADGIQISVEKTQFALNEGIDVTVTGIDATLQTHDLELRLERDILLADADYANRSDYNGYRQYFDIGKDARDGAGNLIPSAETMKVTFQNGGRYHPENGGVASIPAGTYTIWIIDYTDNKAIGNKVHVSVQQITLSTEKTEFLYGEPIEVTVSGLVEEAYYTSGKWHDLEFRLENTVLADDVGFKYRATYHQYFDIGDAAKDESGNTMTSIPETRTWTFQNGGIKHPTAGGTTSIPAGAYTLWILDFTNSIVVSNKVDILVYDITISTEKTEFIQGEKIAVDFSGVDYHTTSNNKDIELRIESGWGYDPIGFTARRGASVAYADLSKDCTGGKVDNVYVGNAGTKVFPDQDGRYKANNSNKYTVGLGYPAGKYTLWVLDYTQAHICSNKIEITIRAAEPELKLEKNTFTYGEPINVSYSEITDYLMKSCSAWLQIDIFKAGQVVGQISNTAAYHMYNKDGSVDMTGGEENLIHSGTITFPADDTEDKGANFPLAPGEWYICIRKDNSIVGEPVYFTVEYPTVEAGKSTFAFGENITVNFNNIYPNIKTGLELRMYPDEYTIGKTQSLAWATMVNANEGVYTLMHGQSGTLTFPENDDRSPKLYSTYPVGTYHLVLVDYDGKVCSNEYTFTISKPDAIAQPELKNSITMHYTVECDDDVNGAVSMLFTMNGNDVTVDGVAGEVVNGKKTYAFAFENILPQQMGDDIAAKLIIDGKVVYTFDAYSLLTYATNKLASNEAVDVAAHDVIIAMLNYGAEAQLNFGYKTDALVNSALSDGQKQLPAINSVTGVQNKVSGTVVDGYLWKAATLDLQSTLAFRLKFEASDISKVVISDGTSSWNFQDNPEYFKGGNGTYYFYYKNIMAHQFATEFEITMYVDGVEAQTVTYSVNTYISYIGTKDSSNVKSICQALYAYGVEANAYGA